MRERSHLLRTFWTLFLVVAGNIFYALTVKLFLLPAGLVTGGTTGIALAVYHGFGISVSLFLLVFNVAKLIGGYFLLGKNFAVTTIISTINNTAAV